MHSNIKNNLDWDFIPYAIFWNFRVRKRRTYQYLLQRNRMAAIPKTKFYRIQWKLATEGKKGFSPFFTIHNTRQKGTKHK